MLNGYTENQTKSENVKEKTNKQRNNINELLHLFAVHFSCKVLI